jgi:DNA-binding response OmpR family regulator
MERAATPGWRLHLTAREPIMKVLLIEDDKATRSLIRRSLTARGHSVREADCAGTGEALARTDPFDVLIIDIQLPDGDGLEICRRLRRDGVAVPILFLTARGEVGDRVAGLDAGADDYLRKPFALAELDARIRALGRRQGAVSPVLMQAAGLEIDFTARILRRRGTEVPMTAREWRVLEVLASRAGRVVRRDELLSLAWGDSGPSASESLAVIMSRIRRKLGHDKETSLIRTVRGEGYVLETPR